MKRMLIGFLIGLALVAAGRRLRTPADDVLAAAAEAARRDDHARAAEAYRRAEALAAAAPAVFHNHAAALYRQGRYADAEELYARSAEGSEVRAARAAYNRGNCIVSQGCPDGESSKPDFLTRAIDQYRACLDQEGRCAPGGTLFADARYNLELAKALLNQRNESEAPPASPPAEDKPPSGDATSADASQPDKPEALAQNDPARPDGAPPQPEDECPH